MVGLFLVAAVVTVVAIPPALALGGADAYAGGARPTAPATRVGRRRWRPQNPASSSDRIDSSRAGEPVARRRARDLVGRPPGTIRVVGATVDGTRP